MATRVPAKSKATYEDLAQLPEHLVGEILGGELHASPRPSAPHTLAARRSNPTWGGLSRGAAADPEVGGS